MKLIFEDGPTAGYDQDEATAAWVASGGPIPEGCHVRATLVADLSGDFDDDEWLWQLDCVYDDPLDDETDLPVFIGSRTILGPDGRTWTMGTAPFAYDGNVADRALARLYQEGVADLIDQETLADQIQRIVKQRDAAIDALPDAVRRGDVRRKPAKD